MENQDEATVILGCGIIGLSTAYYLSHSHSHSKPIHIVDPSPLFSCASGSAAGFLARDWHRQSVTSLAALSFSEHERLAEIHDGAERWGFANTCALSYDFGSGGGLDGKRGEDWLLEGTSRAGEAQNGREEGEAPRWWKRTEGDSVHVVDESAAIVDPLKLCRFLLAECLSKGVRLHNPASPIAILKNSSNSITGIRIRTSSRDLEIPATKILLSAGPWTPSLFRTLFPTSTLKIPVSSLAGHSLVLKAAQPGNKQPENNKQHAVFCSLPNFSPEIFSRQGVIYIAGLNATLPLPEPTGPATPTPGDIQVLRDVADELLDCDGEVLKEALCFRPITEKGVPLLGRIDDRYLGLDSKTGSGGSQGGGGVFIAAGHGPWGISLSLGTGRVMADLIQGRPLSADITALGLDSHLRIHGS